MLTTGTDAGNIIIIESCACHRSLTDKHKTDAQCIVPVCVKLLSQRHVNEDRSHRLPGVMMLYRCKVTGFCQNNKRTADDLDIMLHT